MKESYKELESMVGERLPHLYIRDPLRLKAAVEDAVEKALEKDSTVPFPKSEEEIVDYVLNSANLIALLYLKNTIKAEAEKKNE